MKKLYSTPALFSTYSAGSVTLSGSLTSNVQSAGVIYKPKSGASAGCRLLSLGSERSPA